MLAAPVKELRHLLHLRPAQRIALSASAHAFCVAITVFMLSSESSCKRRSPALTLTI
jgi:hypothetical protein